MRVFNNSCFLHLYAQIVFHRHINMNLHNTIALRAHDTKNNSQIMNLIHDSMFIQAADRMGTKTNSQSKTKMESGIFCDN